MNSSPSAPIGLPRRGAALAACVLALAAVAGDVRAKDMIPFSDASFIIEMNATDNDAGVQAFVDGEGWDRMRIVGPDGRTVLTVRGKGSVGDLGLTELFFESEEPSLDEHPLDEFLARFPAGTYRFYGRTVEGERLFGTATLTHVIPAGPEIVTPAEDEAVDPDNAEIVWNPVTEPPGVDIVGYQVIVVQEDPPREFVAELPPTATRMTVPPEFFGPGAEYKLEILATEASGNRTISEREFETE